MTPPNRTDLSASGVAALQRRTLTTLVIAQMLGGAGLAAGITVGALLAEDVLGATSFSGLPAALFTSGSAAAALLLGRLSQRSGRRVGLTAGYAAGAIGGGGIVLAAVWDNIPLFVVAMIIYGAGFAANLQARYAGADLADPSRRGRAISIVLVATTVGAVAGPNLVKLTGRAAESVGMPELTGPFALAAIAYAAAALVLALFLRPDPLLIARALGAGDVQETHEAVESPTGKRTTVNIRFAALAMVLTQVVMIAVMTMTPVHMRDHGHGLGSIGFVIAIHVAFMYLPSPLTGVLVDRVGRLPVIGAAATVLLLAGLVAASAPADSVALLTLALALLGLGWNLGLIGGTALLTDNTPLATRARTQGTVDLSVALAGAAGGLSSGFIVASTSYPALALVGGALALLILPATLGTRRLAVSAR